MLTDSGYGAGPGYGDGSRSGLGDGHGAGAGFGYGYGDDGAGDGRGDGFGSGSGYGYGAGDGHVPVGEPIVMVEGEHPVTAVRCAPGYFLVGCKGPYSIRYWETHWREYAEQEELDISEQEAEEALEAMRLHAAH